MRRLIPLFVLLALVAAYAPAFAAPRGVTLISAGELKAKIDGNVPVVILDVRSRGAYDHSDIAIKGAIRIAPDELPDRTWELPMGKAIATFCT
ncbi:MAG: rhodanese-like domain-containing protein [Thermodesulfobacteriota bacterium]